MAFSDNCDQFLINPKRVRNLSKDSPHRINSEKTPVQIIKIQKRCTNTHVTNKKLCKFVSLFCYKY